MLVESQNPVDLTVIFYRTSSIGDVILSTACLNYLETLVEPVRVLWIGREPTLSVIQKAYPAVKTINANAMDKFLGDAKNTESIKKTLVVDLQNNWRSQRIAKKLKKKFAAQVVAFQKDRVSRALILFKARLRGRRLPSHRNNTIVQDFQYLRMVNVLCQGLTRIGISSSNKSHPSLPKPSASQNSTPWQKELSLLSSWIAVAPGAAHPTKRCPVTIFSAVLAEFKKQQSEGKTGLLILGDETDRALGTEIENLLAWKGPFLNLAGKLSLWESSLALRHAKVLLTNDSALLHISEAVNTPVAALFGPTAEIFGFSPWHPQSQAFSSLIGCRPCSKHGELPCRYRDLLCFASLPIESVVKFLGEKCR